MPRVRRCRSSSDGTSRGGRQRARPGRDRWMAVVRRRRARVDRRHAAARTAGPRPPRRMGAITAELHDALAGDTAPVADSLSRVRADRRTTSCRRSAQTTGRRRRAVARPGAPDRRGARRGSTGIGRVRRAAGARRPARRSVPAGRRSAAGDRLRRRSDDGDRPTASNGNRSSATSPRCCNRIDHVGRVARAAGPAPSVDAFIGPPSTAAGRCVPRRSTDRRDAAVRAARRAGAARVRVRRHPPARVGLRSRRTRCARCSRTRMRPIDERARSGRRSWPISSRSRTVLRELAAAIGRARCGGRSDRTRRACC